ncbi:hypothetical protein HH310_28840 [Actinoplanes sp. TBRC 11911]|uniref:hypothetical protein n=1 Tax=Actinoplanes sp. TBRC 11911 TaxID=2729386 RepID=UPI00145E62EC|nr:hypothetical protein [Actinoplanes sp. TBRC 11911]NMO55179.1 hypothetical protein [Actinoplanes sp. TBRC 11911]
MPSSYASNLHTPSAVLFDGIVPVPLWAVTQMAIDASYAVPAVGGSNRRVALPTHDDTIGLTAVLLGPLRLEWKAMLENIAEASRYGTVLSPKTGGLGTGLVLVTSATVRTNLAVQSLSFSLTAARQDTIDVTMRLIHLPPPGSLTRLLDVTSIGVGALTDRLPF